MKLSRIVLTAAHLNRIPTTERGVLVLCGHVVNKLNVLNNLLLLVTEQEPESVPVSQAQALQSMVLLKTIVGKLYEAWNAISKGYLKSKLARELDQKLESESLTALESLKKYFGNKSAISIVRNNFAFHYSIEHAKNEIPIDTPEEDLSVYLASPIGNYLYQFAEFVMNSSLMVSLDPSRDIAMSRLVSESQLIIGWFNDLAHGLMVVILERHVLSRTDAPEVTALDIGDVATISDRKVDFFFDIT